MASYGERRRHYRVGKKEVSKHTCKKTFFTKKNKGLLIAGGIFLSIIIFVKGMLIGMYLSRD